MKIGSSALIVAGIISGAQSQGGIRGGKAFNKASKATPGVKAFKEVVVVGNSIVDGKSGKGVKADDKTIDASGAKSSKGKGEKMAAKTKSSKIRSKADGIDELGGKAGKNAEKASRSSSKSSSSKSGKSSKGLKPDDAPPGTTTKRPTAAKTDSPVDPPPSPADGTPGTNKPTQKPTKSPSTNSPTTSSPTTSSPTTSGPTIGE